MISVPFPGWGLRRLRARASMSQVEDFLGGSGGYDAGKKNRLTRYFGGSNQSENTIDRAQISQLRHNSWHLFRNNPHARKVVRTLQSKVIGPGLQPQSQALREDGTPHVEFREWAQDLWNAVVRQLDYRGPPGLGGQSSVELQKTALASVILSGDCLYRFRKLKRAQADDLGLLVPIQLQLIHRERLADDMSIMSPADGNRIVNGIELNRDGTRVAYHLYDVHPSEGDAQVIRVLANQIGHLYVADDIEQQTGVPWFASALMQMRDTGDYQFNELKASAVAACVVLTYSRGSGQTGDIGTVDPSGELLDGDGNRVTAMQPGMILDVGSTGSVTGFNPARPNTNAEAWIQHMTRTTAQAFPGVKSSTLTGDYRGASFSSERSNDNDVWPEIHGVQEWFASGFCQPIYEELIKAAVLDGYFQEIINESDFAERQAEFLNANWKGPVALSINPVDDASAAGMRIKVGISSPQIECGSVGRDWRTVLSDTAEFISFAQETGLPESYVQQILGGVPTKQVGLTDDEPNEEGDTAEATDDTEALRARIDTYGIGVRAGSLTPQIDDEDYFRSEAGLPSLSAAARAAWAKDKGVRRPITLVQESGKSAAGNSDPGDETDDDDQETDEAESPADAVA